MTILRGNQPWYYPTPGKNDCCALCRGPLYYPFLQWTSTDRSVTDYHEVRENFICKECCEEIRSGFTRDLKEMHNLKQLQRLGFHKAEPGGGGDVFIPPENSQH
jgi:hypothetical protein